MQTNTGFLMTKCLKILLSITLVDLTVFFLSFLLKKKIRFNLWSQYL